MSFSMTQFATGLYTAAEFNARCKIPETKWATLLDSNTGEVVHQFTNTYPSSEKTS